MSTSPCPSPLSSHANPRQSGGRSSTATWRQRFSLGLMLLALTGLSACAVSEAQSVKSGKGGAKGPVPVVAATVARRTMPLMVRTTGTVQAYSTVSVKSQVPGQLIGVYFREGQEVHQGDHLFTIDPRTLQSALDQAISNRAKAVAQVDQARAAVAQADAQVNQAKANVTKELAQAKNNDVQAQRYSSLYAEGAVSKSQVDQFNTSAETQRATVVANQSNVGNAEAAVEVARANLQNAEAAVGAADAAVDNAKVQLSYTTINSPIDGQTGKLNFNRGNLIKDNDSTPLVVISQIRPIYVAFSIPQRLLPELKRYQANGRLEVDVMPTKDGGKPVRGELVFVDSGVDATTGTIQLKASFTNADARLTPGQFVNVALKLTEEPNAIVVPSAAVQTGQKGSFVYVIKSDQTVEARSVTTGNTVDNQTVITTGLQPGERVVTDGQFNLAPGATVREKTMGEAGKAGKSSDHATPDAQP